MSTLVHTQMKYLSVTSSRHRNVSGIKKSKIILSGWFYKHYAICNVLHLKESSLRSNAFTNESELSFELCQRWDGTVSAMVLEL